MKKIGIVLSIVLLSFVNRPVFAADNASPSALKDQIVSLSPNQTVTGDYFAAGKTVIVSGTVTGDAYVAGGQVIFDGTVQGDLLVAGGSVTLSGKVNQNVRLIGGNIIINGEVGKNITVLAGNVQTTSTAKLDGNLVGGVGNLIMDSPVKGNLRAFAGNLTLTNTIGGNAHAFVGQLTLASKAKVTGDLTYTSDQTAVIGADATVSGVLTHLLPTSQPALQRLNIGNFRQVFPQKVKQAVGAVTSTVFILGFLNSLVVGFLLVHFFPTFSYQAILGIEEHPWKTLGVGLLGVIITPFLIILSLALVIGLSFGAITAIWYAITLYFAKIMFSYWLGARFIQGMERMAGPSVTIFVGLAIYSLLSLVTYIGPVVSVIALIFGAGTVLRSLKDSYLTGRVAKVF
jgi:cytoskeletal protein CcmA (bactofilin family)